MTSEEENNSNVIISLELTNGLQEERQTISKFTFDPVTSEATLKLNGIHEGISPTFTFPISFDKDIKRAKGEIHKIENKTIGGIWHQLQIENRVDPKDIAFVISVLEEENNRRRMVESIREWHRHKLRYDDEYYELISVSEAIRQHDGRYKVNGTITGISQIYKAFDYAFFYCNRCDGFAELNFDPPEFNSYKIKKICSKCGVLSRNGLLNPDYRNAVIVELEDPNTFNEMDRLTVYLFDTNTENIVVGETVNIEGKIKIVEAKKLHSCLYGEQVEYLNKENFTLTKEDIDEIEEFVANTKKEKENKTELIDKLISIFDTSIVGYNHVKKGLLMSAVNTSDDISRNERINVLLIGDPGLAKSKLAKRVTKLVPKSRHESGQSSTGKSLTAIIEKTDDNTFLRPGPIPLARGAICSINEIGRQSMEDQGHLLDVMEEGEFTKNAFGKHVRIKSPTTIVATTNPVGNSRWRDKDKIDLNDFPVLEPIKDRFDLLFIFKDRGDSKEKREFANKLTEIEDGKDNESLSDDRQFLTKYIQYAKKIQPKINEEAKIMLKEFYIEVSNKNFGSPRVLITLRKLAKAIARLKLKNIVDEYDAKEVMEFYNTMLVNFQKSVIISQPPKDIAYQECVSLLEDIKSIGAITLEELIVTICKDNEQLSHYFGFGEKSFKMRDNIKIRDLCDRLLNHSNIKRVQEKPVVLQWLEGQECDPCDPCDANTKQKTENNNNLKSNEDNKNIENELILGSHTSHRSHRVEPAESAVQQEKTNLRGYKISEDGPIHFGPDLIKDTKEANEKERRRGYRY